MFLGWFDDTPKKSASAKIEEAVERYIAKFGEAPNICLVNAVNVTPFGDLEVRAVEYVRPNHFWVGRDETVSVDAQAA